MTTYLDSVPRWVWALVIAALAFVIIETTKRWTVLRLRKAAGRFNLGGLSLIADILESIYPTMTLAYAGYIGARFMELPPKLDTIFDRVLILALLLQVGFWGVRLIDFGLRILIERRSLQLGHQDSSLAALMPTLKFVGRLLLFALLLLLALDNLGFNISALIAGLGVGGIAVALAVQNVLGDVFSSLSIVLDKPFEVGDSITVGSTTGTVEKIGLKTTRLRSTTGQQVIFSNTNLLNAEINNFKRMTERRNTMTLGLVYETPLQKLKEVPQILEAVIKSHSDKVRFDRAHFKGFGAFSLDFEVSYFVLSPDIESLMDAQQAINYEIAARFEAAGLSFAYPSQTLFLQNCDKAFQTTSK